MKFSSRLLTLAAAATALLPLSSVAQISLTLIDYDPNSTWTVNSTNGTNTSTQNAIGAMQTHTSVPPIYGQTTFELFCIEIGQNTAPLNVAQSGYQLRPLHQASLGIPLSQTMETYAGISGAGLGLASAERVSKLYAQVFGAAYTPSLTLVNDTLKAAFQLAVWEVSHDNDFSLGHPGAGIQGFYVTGSNPGLYNDAIAQANAWLAALQANFNALTGMELAVLHHDTRQDLIIAIPEPSAYAAVLAAAAMLAAHRRRTRLVDRFC
jgi:hypothetical protein